MRPKFQIHYTNKPSPMENERRELNVDQPRKRRRCTSSSNGQDLISHLPDECIFEIFSFLPSFRDRCSCAAVSKKWLIMQANMGSTGFKTTASTLLSKTNKVSRSLEGRKANDTRLAAIAVGVCPVGGLAHLSIRGGLNSQGLTDFGLQIISNACSNLKSLTLWDCPKAEDRGLTSISEFCYSLESLDLFNCPLIGDQGVTSVAKNCPNLLSLSVDSCQLITDQSLRALSMHALKIRSIALVNCPAIGDDGVISLSSSLPNLEKIKLVSLRLGDCVLEVIGKHGASLRSLWLENILGFTEMGFCSVGLLEKLASLTLKSCSGMIGASFRSGGNMFTGLKQILIMDNETLTDEGLKELTQSAKLLESIKLQKCGRVSSNGLLEIFMNCNQRLKLLALVKCHGLQERGPLHNRKLLPKCPMLESLTLHRCAGIGDSFLSWLGTACVRLRNIELVGLNGVTDRGILSLFSHTMCVKSVDLSGCLQLSDLSILAIAIAFGKKLQSFRMGGCESITDKSLQIIAEFCPSLLDLDLSKCGITDNGVFSLAISKHQRLEVLSLAGCLGITDKSLEFIALMCGTLVGLNLKHCPWLSKEGIQSVKETLWWSDLLY